MPLRPTHPQFSPRPITHNALGGHCPLVHPPVFISRNTGKFSGFSTLELRNHILQRPQADRSIGRLQQSSAPKKTLSVSEPEEPMPFREGNSLSILYSWYATFTG